MLLDLNNPEFQRSWFALEKPDRIAVLKACIKLHELTWELLYRDRGFRWEKIHSRKYIDGTSLYSMRLSIKMRAVVRRDGDFLEFLALHPDHDSAY